MSRTVVKFEAPKCGDIIALIDVDNVERHFRLYGEGGAEGQPFDVHQYSLGFYIGPGTSSPSGNIWFKRNPDYTTYVVPSRTDSEKLAEIRNILDNDCDLDHIWEVLDS